MTTTPSPRAYPSAAASKVLHRPSAASIPAFARLTVSVGATMRLTPPTTARSISPVRRDRTAWWSATSELEHAVSIDIDGPVNPKVYEIRPLAVLGVAPALKYWSTPPRPATATASR